MEFKQMLCSLDILVPDEVMLCVTWHNKVITGCYHVSVGIWEEITFTLLTWQVCWLCWTREGNWDDICGRTKFVSWFKYKLIRNILFPGSWEGLTILKNKASSSEDQASWSWFCAWDPNVEAEMCLPKGGKIELFEEFPRCEGTIKEVIVPDGCCKARKLTGKI